MIFREERSIVAEAYSDNSSGINLQNFAISPDNSVL